MIFCITAADKTTNARRGTLTLGHGKVETPVFMPVGTNGVVKAISHETLEDIGYRLILGNTYHLVLRPGMDIMKEIGGLHRFSSWKYNFLTDSGGFQIFSLAQFRKITEEGVVFRSHIDGAKYSLTPEEVIDIQHTIGSDILMPLDVCTPPQITYQEAVEALERTSRWAERSKRHHTKKDNSKGFLFGIVQGNFFKELRERSVYEIAALDFPGIAIGGLSVGESFETFSDFLTFTTSLLPFEKPRYVMGIGTPEFILKAVEVGIDMFDCVFPTRIARNGAVFTRKGILSLKKEEYKYDMNPIDPDCPCRVCTHYSRAYIRHLIKTKEILGPMITTEHNLFFIFHLMEEIKQHISNGSFSTYKNEFLNRYLDNSL